MKGSMLVAAVSLLFAGLASAQYQGVPKCAQDCVSQTIPQSCGSDPICICQYPGFIDNISCCVSKACDASSVQQALDTANSICKGANVALPTAAGCSGSSSSPSSTSGSAGAASTSGAARTTTTSAAPAGTGNPANKLVVNGMGLAGALLGAAAVL